MKQILISEKGSSHLPLKTQEKINEEQDGQHAIVEYTRQMCWFKTLVGLQSLARFDAKHHRCTTTNALDEDAIVDIKQKGRSTIHK